MTKYLNPEDVYKQACLILEWEFDKVLREVENNHITDKTIVQVRQWTCHYYLNLPLDHLDIRAEDENGKHGVKKRIKLELGKTTTEGCIETQIWEDKEINLPFRDGAHIHWDSKKLNLPMYVISEGKAQRLEPRD